MLQLKIPRAETKTQHSQINILNKLKKSNLLKKKKEHLLLEPVIPAPRYLFHKYSPTIAKIYANIFFKCLL